MAGYVGTFDQAFTLNAAESLVGSLPGGYFVTVRSDTYDLYLRSVATPTTASGTVTGSFDPGYVINNDVGDLYLLSYVSSTTQRLTHITESGGVLSATTIGTATVPLGGFTAPLHLTHDGSQIVGRPLGGDGAHAINTSDASTAYTSAAPSHNVRLLSAPAADRYLAYCFDDYQFELWDGPGNALLDTLTGEGDLDWEPGFYPTGANKTFGAWTNSSISSGQRVLGVIDSTSDSLTWAWGPTTITTNWSSAPLESYVACWGQRAVVFPGENPTGGGSLYVVDTGTGEVNASASSSYLQGVDNSRAVGFCGPDSVVAFHVNTTDGWTLWDIAPSTGPTFLRQRQSPVRTPSRVRGVDLRQSQTPRITR